MFSEDKVEDKKRKRETKQVISQIRETVKLYSRKSTCSCIREEEIEEDGSEVTIDEIVNYLMVDKLFRQQVYRRERGIDEELETNINFCTSWIHEINPEKDEDIIVIKDEDDNETRNNQTTNRTE